MHNRFAASLSYQEAQNILFFFWDEWEENWRCLSFKLERPWAGTESRRRRRESSRKHSLVWWGPWNGRIHQSSLVPSGIRSSSMPNMPGLSLLWRDLSDPHPGSRGLQRDWHSLQLSLFRVGIDIPESGRGETWWPLAGFHLRWDFPFPVMLSTSTKGSLKGLRWTLVWL